MKRHITLLWASIQHNPSVAIAIVVCLTIALIVAMHYQYDLSWIPGFLQGLIVGGGLANQSGAQLH